MTPTPPVRRLLQNARYVPEKGVYLRSSHVHDYVTLTLDDGVEVSTDGGTSYLHRSVNDPKRVVDWDLYADDPFDTIATRLLWGSYGRYGKGPLVIKPLAKCTLAHLKAILATQMTLVSLHRRVVEHWIRLKERPQRKRKLTH